LLAALTGVKRDITANVRGSGSFSEWHGWGVARAGGQRIAGFLLDNRAGRYRLAGQIFPRDLLTGTARQAVGEKLSILAEGTVTRADLKGRVFAGGAAFKGMAAGAVDLANRRAMAVKLRAPKPSAQVEWMQALRAACKARQNVELRRDTWQREKRWTLHCHVVEAFELEESKAPAHVTLSVRREDGAAPRASRSRISSIFTPSRLNEG
jgi:hypothetical protein